MNTPTPVQIKTRQLESDIRTLILKYEAEVGLKISALNLARGGVTDTPSYILYGVGVTLFTP